MEHGDDGYPTGFCGIELLSAVLDDMQFYDEDEEDKHHYNDINAVETFYPPSALHGVTTAGDILRESNNRRGMVSNLQTEKTSSRSELLPEPCFKSSEADLITFQIGHSWAKPSAMHQYSDANAVRSEGFLCQGIGVSRSPVGVRTNMNAAAAGDSGGEDAIATLFVGDLQWWTTDADLEAELCKYGSVKRVKFFEEKSNGKSKGFAQVELYDLASAMSCQEGMNGHIFNGRSCVVAITSLQGVNKLGEAQVSRNQQRFIKGPSRFAITQMGGGRAHIAVDSAGEGGGGAGCGWGLSEMRMSRTSAGNGGGFPLWPARRAFRGIPVDPHSNPDFLGRGMSTGGVGMWAEPSMVGWGAEEQSGHGDYGEESHGKYRGAGWDWLGDSDRRHGRDRGTLHGLEWSEIKEFGERDGGWDKADIWRWRG